MSELGHIEAWVLACRTDGGPWYIRFARTIYSSYEEAARQAFAWNEEKGYRHKPVRVRVIVEGD